MNIKHVAAKRRMRGYQEAHRGIVAGAQTNYENAAIIASWLAGDLTEGQVATAFGIDRMRAREMRDDVLRFGMGLASELWKQAK